MVRPIEINPEDVVKNAEEYYLEASKREHKIITPEKGPVKVIPPKYPCIEEFLLRYNYTNYIYELERKHENIKAAIDKIRRLQAVMLQQNGLEGTYQSNVVALLGKNFHGWKDKSEIEVQGSLADKIVEARKRLKENEVVKLFAD